MPVPGLSLLGLKRIRGFASILRYINPTIIIIISSDKLEAIYAECIEVSTKTSLLKRKYQSLLGKLLYIQKCVKPARVFINRLLATFCSNSHLKTIPLSAEKISNVFLPLSQVIMLFIHSET